LTNRVGPPKATVLRPFACEGVYNVPDPVKNEGEEPPPNARRPSRNRPRPAKEVINQAIDENKFGEYLLYSFASVFVLCGMLSLVVGLIRNEGLIALAGGIASALFFPAMWQARAIRRENIAIRLLELPLSMAETSREASLALKEFFLDTFPSRKADP
jgi:hypothetical protein